MIRLRDTTIVKGANAIVERNKRLGEWNPSYKAVKRLIDILAASMSLILLGPLLLFIALIVHLDSDGPALFRQERVGCRGKCFTLLKFRTMRWGTPDIPTDQMRTQVISPVTRFGKVLRRTSLDELPQLVNVLKGEMSLIGPRPALPSQDFVNQHRRESGVESLLPGITGWAQVCGRDNLADLEKVEHDAFYRANQSLKLDLLIAVRTVTAVFSGRGTR